MPGYRSGYSSIVGYNSIVGAADGGALAAQAAQRRAMRGAGVQYPVGGYGAGPQVTTRNSDIMRAFPLGFFSAAVAKATQALVSEKPQVTFRGERLVLPNQVDSADNPFVLNQIQVGQRNQFVSATSLMAEVFFDDAVGVALELDTATVGQDITLTVTNTDPANPHDFNAVFIGTCNLPG